MTTDHQHEPKGVKNPTEFHVRSVPKELRDRFKAACARKGTSMRRAILAYMESESKENGT